MSIILQEKNFIVAVIGGQAMWIGQKCCTDLFSAFAWIGYELGQPHNLPPCRATGSLLTCVLLFSRKHCHLIQQEYFTSRILPHLLLGSVLCRALGKNAQSLQNQNFLDFLKTGKTVGFCLILFLYLLPQDVSEYSRIWSGTCFHYKILLGGKIMQKRTSLITNHWKASKFIKRTRQ